LDATPVSGIGYNVSNVFFIFLCKSIVDNLFQISEVLEDREIMHTGYQSVSEIIDVLGLYFDDNGIKTKNPAPPAGPGHTINIQDSFIVLKIEKGHGSVLGCKLSINSVIVEVIGNTNESIPSSVFATKSRR